MTHKDSLGNEDTIGDGEVQWMTAGSGIMHEENCWLPSDCLVYNLAESSRKGQTGSPAYHSIKNSDIEKLILSGV